MFGTLLTLGLGLYCIGDAASKSVTTQENKNEAKSNGKPYYYDGKNKMRSTVTNEIVTYIFADPSHNGHDVLVGCTSGRVYADYTIEKLNAENKKLKEEGKKYYWKEYQNVKESGKNACSWKSTFWPYDPEKGRCYHLQEKHLSPFDPKNKEVEDLRYYIKSYYKENPGMFGFDFDYNIPSEKLSRKEAEPWNYQYQHHKRF